MANRPLRAALEHLRRVTGPAEAGGSADAELLRRWVALRDGAAFELLLRRHAPIVLGVCGRLLRSPADAEDAFQATFLALARAAGSIRRREAAGAWLYRVAYHAALRLRADAARHLTSGLSGADLPAAPVTDDPLWRDLRPVLDAEINRLPNKLRAAFLLCHLEGRTNEEAARELGCPLGTVLSRLSRARERLRDRLTRLGLAPAVAASAVALTADALSTPPPAVLAGRTMGAAAGFVAKQPAITGAVPARVAALVQGVLRVMWEQKAKYAAAMLLTLGVFGTGAGLLGFRAPARQPSGGKEAAPVPVAKAAPAPDEAAQIAELAKARLAAAREVYDSMMDTYRAGRLSIDDIYLWSPHLLEAELDAATTKAERIEARQAHVKRMREHEKYIKSLFDAARAGPRDLAEAKLLRTEAELRLAQEKFAEKHVR
jgi:RNA polymerase sigma factor (sigma-70 family)